MKYIKYNFTENTIGRDDYYISYWELDSDGYVIRSIEITKEGNLTKYDTEHEADQFGQLPEGTITDENLQNKSFGLATRISFDNFNSIWQKPAKNRL